MSYSESGANSNFAINSASNFDSSSESNSEFESDFSSVFMKLDIFVFFILYLHSSKETCEWFFYLFPITESIVMQAVQV